MYQSIFQKLLALFISGSILITSVPVYAGETTSLTEPVISEVFGETADGPDAGSAASDDSNIPDSETDETVETDETDETVETNETVETAGSSEIAGSAWTNYPRGLFSTDGDKLPQRSFFLPGQKMIQIDRFELLAGERLLERRKL